MGELEKLDDRLSSLKSDSFLFNDKPLFEDSIEVEQLEKSQTATNNDPSWEDYTIEDTLGQGSYGQIFKVRERAGDKRLLVVK